MVKVLDILLLYIYR